VKSLKIFVTLARLAAACASGSLSAWAPFLLSARSAPVLLPARRRRPGRSGELRRTGARQPGRASPAAPGTTAMRPGPTTPM
jgi:hypothetical protein